MGSKSGQPREGPAWLSRPATRRKSTATIRTRLVVWYARFVPTDLEDEETWLRHRIMRMRTILRFAKDPRTEAGLRELIAEAEARLTALEARRPLPMSGEP
jgi:hypothetical protein